MALGSSPGAPRPQLGGEGSPGCQTGRGWGNGPGAKSPSLTVPSQGRLLGPAPA